VDVKTLIDTPLYLVWEAGWQFAWCFGGHLTATWHGRRLGVRRSRERGYNDSTNNGSRRELMSSANYWISFCINELYVHGLPASWTYFPVLVMCINDSLCDSGNTVPPKTIAASLTRENAG
jgi:hypothetical protein